MKICVLDDHPLVLEGVSTALGRQGHVVYATQSVEEASNILREHAPFDILLLDYYLPQGRGTDLLNHSDIPLPPRIAVLSAMSDPEDMLYVLETTSVNAVVLKHTHLEELAESVKALVTLDVELLKGCIWDTARRRFVSAASAFPRGTVLTPKEREVFMLLRKGLLDKQIADLLGRSVHTVRVQLRSIRRKRGLSRRAAVDLELRA